VEQERDELAERVVELEDSLAAAPAAAMEAAPSVDSAELDALKARVRELEVERDRYANRALDLEEEIEEARAASMAAPASMGGSDEAKAEAERLKQELARKEERLARERQSTEDLMVELERLQKSAGGDSDGLLAEIDELKSALDDAIRERDRLQKHLDLLNT
jgi:chromosome segregation ATPase